MTVKVGNLDFSINESFQKVESMPDDPPGSIPFCAQTDKTGCFVMLRPMAVGQTMPFDDDKEIIDGIHGCLGPDQGLIHVESGKTSMGRNYVYSIVKTVPSKPSENSLVYCLTFHMADGRDALQVQAFFQELGVTGVRENTVLNMLMNEGKLQMGENGIEGWLLDPYDAGFDRGIRMNLAEKEEYDEAFPTFPISVCRNFLKEIKENN